MIEELIGSVVKWNLIINWFMMINIAELLPSLLSIQAKGIVRVWLDESNIGSGKIVLLCFLGQYKCATKVSQETCFFSISAASNRHLSKKIELRLLLQNQKEIRFKWYLPSRPKPSDKNKQIYYFYPPWLLAGRTRSLKNSFFHMATDEGRSFSPVRRVNVHVSMASKIIDFPSLVIGLEIRCLTSFCTMNVILLSTYSFLYF